MKGVVAAGHPLLPGAGADALRAGGNAVDAPVACVLMSWVAESPLTGPGAGGFMLLHAAEGGATCSTSSSRRPVVGLGDHEPAELHPDRYPLLRGRGPAFQRRPVLVRGLWHPAGPRARRSSASAAAGLAELTAGSRSARARASRSCRCRPSCSRCSSRSCAPRRSATALRSGRRLLREGDTFRLPELGDLLERLGAEGPGFLYTGDVAARVSEWVLERGGLLTREDLAAYEVVERPPARSSYRGREVLTNPPPSSGRDPDRGRARHPGAPGASRTGPDVIAEVIASTNRARDEEFLAGLARRATSSLPGKDALDNVATEVRSRLGNTTHISVMDADGACVGHLLERVLLGRGRARHRDAPQQHARRAGPQPTRVPPPRSRGRACRA